MGIEGASHNRLQYSQFAQSYQLSLDQSTEANKSLTLPHIPRHSTFAELDCGRSSGEHDSEQSQTSSTVPWYGCQRQPTSEEACHSGRKSSCTSQRSPNPSTEQPRLALLAFATGDSQPYLRPCLGQQSDSHRHRTM